MTNLLAQLFPGISTFFSMEPVIAAARVLLIILGLFFAVTGLTISSEALDTATIGTDALSTGKNYYIEDAVILDQFGYTEKDGQTVSYECAVGFGLANDEWVVTAIEVPLKSTLFSTVPYT